MNETKIYHFIRPIGIKISDNKLWVTLEDERVISTPLRWYSWLAEATPEQQNHYELLPDAIYWTDLDEGLEVEGMLRGIRPSPTSHKKRMTNH
jgi:Protein of unknown function (DUF2442)